MGLYVTLKLACEFSLINHIGSVNDPVSLVSEKVGSSNVVHFLICSSLVSTKFTNKTEGHTFPIN